MCILSHVISSHSGVALGQTQPAMEGYDSYIVYLMNFRRPGFEDDFSYVGSVGVLPKQTDRGALLNRKARHGTMTKGWVRGFVPGSLAISARTVGLKGLDQALAEEAFVMAREFNRLGSMGPKLLRGGPWVLRHLTHDDRLELEAAGACSDRSEVAALVRKFPSGSLAAHLAGLDFRRRSTPGTSSSLPAKPFLPILPTPRRQSGKHRPGTPRMSGRHKPGWRPSSGKSGSSLSGAQKRFCRLPFVAPKVCKRPAAFVAPKVQKKPRRSAGTNSHTP